MSDDEFIIPAGSAYQVPPHLRDKFFEMSAARAAAEEAETDAEYEAWTAKADALMEQYFPDAAGYRYMAIEREKH